MMRVELVTHDGLPRQLFIDGTEVGYSTYDVGALADGTEDQFCELVKDLCADGSIRLREYFLALLTQRLHELLE